MSEFLGFAWELLAKVVYNVVAVVSSILNLLVFGWVEYFNIFMTYFTTFDLVGKIGAVILFAMLIAVPVLIVAILVHRYRINRRLHRDDTSNKALYREIGRLNKQVLDLMDEKNKLLALKVNAMGGTKQIPYVGASALADDHLPTVGNVVGAAAGAGAPAGEGATAAVVSGNASLALDGDGVKDAAAAMAKATVEAKTLAEEKEIAQANRFPKLSLVDLKYRDWESPVYDDAISLEDFVDSFRAFACSQMKLYYTPEVIRRFVAGMAASKLLILEGISGTGKTSLPYSFSRYLDNPATIVSVQPSFRDRTEVLGYFNEFSKRFNETEFLRAVYEAGLRSGPVHDRARRDEPRPRGVLLCRDPVGARDAQPRRMGARSGPHPVGGRPQGSARRQAHHSRQPVVYRHGQQRRLHLYHHGQGVRPRDSHRAQRARRRV